MSNCSVLLGLALLGCHSAPSREHMEAPARSAAMDTSAVRRLCEKPDSVMVGRASCVLRDQSRGIKKIP